MTNRQMKKPALDDLFSKGAREKYGCAKSLLALARENPAELYPDLDFFVRLLDSENKILKWTAIDIIGALSRVDEAGAVDRLKGRLVGMLDAGNMITANHAIAALTDVALAKPEYRAEITDELLKVEHYNYDTGECRNITIGKAILAIDTYFDGLDDKAAIVEFVRRQTKNTRGATGKKAEQFLRKHKIENRHS